MSPGPDFVSLLSVFASRHCIVYAGFVRLMPLILSIRLWCWLVAPSFLQLQTLLPCVVFVIGVDGSFGKCSFDGGGGCAPCCLPLSTSEGVRFGPEESACLRARAHACHFLLNQRIACSLVRVPCGVGHSREKASQLRETAAPSDAKTQRSHIKHPSPRSYFLQLRPRGDR